MRLIDADEIEYFPLDEVFNHSVMIAFKERIDVMSTVELIRCKDCKHFTRDSITGVTIPGTEYCIFTMNNRIEENDFCSRAERKTDETD